MKLEVIRIGRAKDKEIEALTRQKLEIAAKISPNWFNIKFSEIKDSSGDKHINPDVIIEKNNHLRAFRAEIFLLSEQGKITPRLAEFPQLIKKKADLGANMVILCGNAFGWKFEDNAREIYWHSRSISLSPITFTHEFAILMLAQQLESSAYQLSGRDFYK